MPSRYSSTPLAKKLGIKAGFTLMLFDPPAYYFDLFDDLPDGLEQVEQADERSVDLIHAFFTTQEQLAAQASELKSVMKKNGLLWISWPKGSSSIPTDLKRDAIRDHVLGIGLVDVKVAAVDDDWSGLKFMYRLKDR